MPLPLREYATNTPPWLSPPFGIGMRDFIACVFESSTTMSCDSLHVAHISDPSGDRMMWSLRRQSVCTVLMTEFFSVSMVVIDFQSGPPSPLSATQSHLSSTLRRITSGL